MMTTAPLNESVRRAGAMEPLYWSPVSGVFELTLEDIRKLPQKVVWFGSTCGMPPEALKFVKEEYRSKPFLMVSAPHRPMAEAQISPTPPPPTQRPFARITLFPPSPCSSSLTSSSAPSSRLCCTSGWTGFTRAPPSRRTTPAPCTRRSGCSRTVSTPFERASQRGQHGCHRRRQRPLPPRPRSSASEEAHAPRRRTHGDEPQGRKRGKPRSRDAGWGAGDGWRDECVSSAGVEFWFPLGMSGAMLLPGAVRMARS
eukprot:scaffold2705_cov109-Isochrysis_galbana.AAC.7